MANTEQSPQQPQGNFVMNLNFRRSGNDKAPPITGRISAPEDPETSFSFSAFHHVDDKGAPYWIGPVDTNRSLRQALSSQPAQGTNFVAIRENGFKVFKEIFDEQGNAHPNPAYTALSAEEQAKEDSKPAYWASWTRTAELPQLRASAWERDPSRYGPWASGNTQHPLTKEEAALLKSGQADAATLTAPEAQAPRRAKTRDDAGARAR